jgi:hypothetical protein
MPAMAPAHAAMPNRIVVQKGDTLQHAVWAAQVRGTEAALRAQWLASGHTAAQLTTLAPPSVTGGAVTAATLTVGKPGQYPTISTSFATDTPGLGELYYVFASPSGQSVYYAAYGAPAYTRKGTVTFRNVSPPSLWSQPGAWTLVSLSIIDGAGTETTYDAAQIASLFKNTSYTIVNSGLVDDKAPRILSGKIATPTVSLSARYPLLRAAIDSVDTGSGLWEGYILVSPPGASYSEYEDVPLAMPLKRGDVNVDTVFTTGDPTGTWSITGFAVCDYAMNCTGSTNDADVMALFGTDTFTVTP